MAIERVEYLFNRYYHKTCTPEEKAELMQYVRDSQYDEIIQSLIDKLYIREEQDAVPGLHALTKAAIVQSILNGSNYQNARVKVRRLNWRRLAIAASFLMLFSVNIYFWFAKQDNADVTNKSQVTEQDISPGTNKATLTLADGSIIQLDSAATGSLANQGNTKIIKLDSGKLAYKITNAYEQPIAIAQYNVITTPRGGQYSIVLPDGSKVWLNAASSLKFPTAFTGKERLVELTGEGYFEIASNKDKPFKVITDGTTVEALGTQFNVNVYPDEAGVQTTLVEGSVRVSQNQKTERLKPGEQLMVIEGKTVKLLKNADVESAIAWKDGYFQFENMPIEFIMRQVARWYNVEIEYKGTIEKKFSLLKVPRNVTASTMFKILEQTGNIRFEIGDKKVMVIAEAR